MNIDELKQTLSQVADEVDDRGGLDRLAGVDHKVATRRRSIAAGTAVAAVITIAAVAIAPNLLGGSEHAASRLEPYADVAASHHHRPGYGVLHVAGWSSTAGTRGGPARPARGVLHVHAQDPQPHVGAVLLGPGPVAWRARRRLQHVHQRPSTGRIHVCWSTGRPDRRHLVVRWRIPAQQRRGLGPAGRPGGQAVHLHRTDHGARRSLGRSSARRGGLRPCAPGAQRRSLVRPPDRLPGPHLRCRGDEVGHGVRPAHARVRRPATV